METTIVQEYACHNSKRTRRGPGLPSIFTQLLKCFECQTWTRTPKANETDCRFQGCCAVMVRKSSGNPIVSFKFPPEPNGAAYPLHFNCMMTDKDAKKKLEALATILYPVFLEEKAHHQEANLIIRDREIETRVTCDACASELFCGAWFCPGCGREVCSNCIERARTIDEVTSPPPECMACSNGKNLLPVTRIGPEELIKTIQKAQQLLVDVVPSVQYPIPVNTLNVLTVRYECRAPSTSAPFRDYWSPGQPVVVTDVPLMKYGPEYFIRLFGELQVEIENCENREDKKTISLADYFGGLGKSATGKTEIMKLKDFPPKTNFRTICRDLYDTFMDVIPFPDMSSLNGVLNFAAHLSDRGPTPDLGPKLYVAQATLFNDEHSGSTVLHMDLTDTVNVMMWSADDDTGSPGPAIWHIFPADASHKVRYFLQQGDFATDLGDPIHSQSLCLTPTLLARLEAEHGVRPYTIYQKPGNAVFIPAGCAHQVSNTTDVIKIACDFVSINHLPATQKLAKEFHAHRLTSGGGDDILQFYNLLYHAWTWISREFDSIILQDRRPHPPDDIDMDFWAQVDLQGPPEVTPAAFTVTCNDKLSGSSQLVQHTFDISVAAPYSKKRPHKRKRPNIAQERRPKDEYRNLACPICVNQYFHRPGLMNHLIAVHSRHIAMDRLLPAKRDIVKKTSVYNDQAVVDFLHSVVNKPVVSTRQVLHSNSL